MTEESREVAEARKAVEGDWWTVPLTGGAVHERKLRLDRLVEAVRKDERERVRAEMKEAATLKIGPGGSISGPAGITYAVAGTRVPGAAPGLPFPVDGAAPAEGGTEG